MSVQGTRVKCPPGGRAIKGSAPRTWRNGRRKGLKIPRSALICRFESGRPHQKIKHQQRYVVGQLRRAPGARRQGTPWGHAGDTKGLSLSLRGRLRRLLAEAGFPQNTPTPSRRSPAAMARVAWPHLATALFRRHGLHQSRVRGMLPPRLCRRRQAAGHSELFGLRPGRSGAGADRGGHRADRDATKAETEAALARTAQAHPGAAGVDAGVTVRPWELSQIGDPRPLTTG